MKRKSRHYPGRANGKTFTKTTATPFWSP